MPNTLSKENELQRKAFELYYGLGDKRSLRAVAETIGRTERTVAGWSRAFNWVARVTQRNIENAQNSNEAKITAELTDVRTKYRILRNVPNNLTEIVDTVSKLDGKVDKETLLSLLPFIDNPKEVLEKLEADKERDRQSTDPYSVQNITNDSNNLFPNLNAQNSPQEALNAQGATIPQPEQ